MSETRDRAASRRDFMRLTAFGAAAGAAAVGRAPAAAQAAEPPESRPDEGGYRLTAHIQSYYELARL